MESDTTVAQGLHITDESAGYDAACKRVLIIMLYLGGPGGENYDGILRMLDVLLSGNTSEAEKRKILQNDYGIQMTRTMEREVSTMCNLSEGVMERGIARGRAEGIAENTLSSIRTLMKNMGISVEQAMKLLEVPEAEQSKYRKLLSKQ